MKYVLIVAVGVVVIVLILGARSKTATTLITIEKVENCKEYEDALKICTCENDIQTCKWIEYQDGGK